MGEAKKATDPAQGSDLYVLQQLLIDSFRRYPVSADSSIRIWPSISVRLTWTFMATLGLPQKLHCTPLLRTPNLRPQSAPPCTAQLESSSYRLPSQLQNQGVCWDDTPTKHDIVTPLLLTARWARPISAKLPLHP